MWPMHDSAFPVDLSRVKRSIAVQSINFYKSEKCFLTCGFMNFVARGSKVRLPPPSHCTTNWAILEFVRDSGRPLVFRAGGTYDRQIISWSDFFSFFTASVTASCFSCIFCSFLSFVSPDSPDFGPPQPCLVIAKEQTQIKHTQGAEALIAAHPALLLVAVGDKMSHLHILFLKKVFSLIHVR